MKRPYRHTSRQTYSFFSEKIGAEKGKSTMQIVFPLLSSQKEK
jgi:hypothetical protein